MREFSPVRIRRRRKRLRLTQLQLAKKAGISRIYVTQLEQGRKVPCANTITRIADALDVNVSYFFVNSVNK